jgi:hypothetical protein
MVTFSNIFHTLLKSLSFNQQTDVKKGIGHTMEHQYSNLPFHKEPFIKSKDPGIIEEEGDDRLDIPSKA